MGRAPIGEFDDNRAAYGMFGFEINMSFSMVGEGFARPYRRS